MCYSYDCWQWEENQSSKPSEVFDWAARLKLMILLLSVEEVVEVRLPSSVVAEVHGRTHACVHTSANAIATIGEKISIRPNKARVVELQ